MTNLPSAPIPKRLYSVVSIHNGSDWAVVDASAEDIANGDGFAMPHEDAVELARSEARKYKCRWFDMSTHGESVAS